MYCIGANTYNDGSDDDGEGDGGNDDIARVTIVLSDYIDDGSGDGCNIDS